MSNIENIRQRAAKSFKWTALIEVVSRTIQPVFYIILARILSPDDFGLASAATIVINFSQLFWDAGLGKALIQTKENIEEAANIVFWINTILGVFLYIVLYFFSPIIAFFFRSNELTPVLQVVGLQVVFQSFYAVQQALFIRNLDFRKLFLIRISSVLVPGLISIPMALAGFGVWSLIAGTLTGSLSNLFLFWSLNSWRPILKINLKLTKQLSGFGFWVLGESLVAWFMNWGDNLIVGHFLGIQSLGIYSMAWNICNMIFGITLNPILSLAYPTFSRLQDDQIALKNAFHRINKILISVSLPIGLGVLLIGQQIASIFFISKWPGLGIVLSLVGLLLGISWTVSANPEVYRSIGRPDINAKLMSLFLLFYLPTFLIAAQFNLTIFSIARLGISLLTIPIHIIVAVRFLHLPFSYFWESGKHAILSSIVMVASVLLIQIVFSNISIYFFPLITLSVQVLIGLLTYFVMFLLVDRQFIKENLYLIKQSFIRKTI